jgi:hypothetical protein
MNRKSKNFVLVNFESWVELIIIYKERMEQKKEC